MLMVLRNIHKSYRLGTSEIEILRGIDLDIDQGDYVAIVGSSGSGKSTLMNILGCLDRPSLGYYQLAGQDITQLPDDDLADVRNGQIGFVFQQFNLLPRLSALENVMLPMVYAGIPKPDRQQRAEALLVQIGLGDRMANRPRQLSGGQQQRVAIARALVNQPSLLLADEPTGALDTKTTEETMALMTDLNRQGITIVIVTHEPEVSDQARRVIRVQDGELISDQANLPQTAL
ncbi:ABC transporter ATP-binding protein [Nodosilinea nodulosa]|uniref:ABC transporter ATP-binding protein n=1 Tax=Nodosilinea nodulosa TaxID=416001 RepID=UPI0002F47B5E|nr:ABC transporter ATP-binding protein [Nodosilinea nodulosa]